MNEQPEQFVPENMRPTRRLRPVSQGSAGFVSVAVDAVVRFVTLLGFGLLLILGGWIVLGLAGPGGLAVWVACLIVALVVLEVKAQDKLHLLWPALLGPLGLIVLLVLPNREKEARAKSAAELDRALRHEELRVQKAILEELQAAREKKGLE